ncbi:MAG: pyridoxal-5-phosphate-dependent protein subunit beta, partial [Candidatus Hodarchaeales archaeon]
MAIKFAKYYELTSKDIVLTVFTDSMELYQSRIKELRAKYGDYNDRDAAVDYHRSLMELKTDSMIELNYLQKKRIHHLKYYTWIEQQSKQLEELDQQWYDESYWDKIHGVTPEIDKLITEFNQKTGLL